MAQPLKTQMGPEVPRRIAWMIASVHHQFPRDAFVQHALRRYESLNLMQRGKKIAASLHEFLPPEYPKAIEILLASVGSRESVAASKDLSPFLYMPHLQFVAEYGLDFFDESMHALHELTEFFTAEFSIRPFLEKHPERTIALLKEWTRAENHHVRRLVSEGTRPRLPWATHLTVFQDDPTPTLELLDLLKDDPEPYVRRSVANHLNDIGKDHPALLIKTARRWLINAGDDRRALVREALRTAMKRGDTEALSLFGFGAAPIVSVKNRRVAPKEICIGQSVEIQCVVENGADRVQQIRADLRVHYVKANGQSRPKVFLWSRFDLPHGESKALRKTLNVVQRTTRALYPGRHVVEIVLNGVAEKIGAFELKPR